MSMLKRAATALGATAATMALTFAVSTPAFAGTDGIAYSIANDGYVAKACQIQFVSIGEHFYLTDAAQDGAGCEGKWFTDKSAEMFNSEGYGKTVEFNFSIPDGTQVEIRVCVETNHNVDLNTCGYIVETA
jgi:hypothetical protein